MPVDLVQPSARTEDAIIRWQRVFDRDYPHGALVTVCDPRVDDAIVYQVPRIEVTDMAGLDPVVALPVFEIDKLLGGRVLSYAVTERRPHLLAQVTLAGHDHRQLWNAGVSGPLAAAMADDRANFIALATEKHGMSWFSGYNLPKA